ncbi:hypothetical protein FNH04_13185 [Streptomyces phyllanthi]|uniref:Uncharacterized protein n=2 Tax=Streptomyces phyllanthi TaxID=1803180 RepID=A0A5N8W168_9ACTN|nr:hypothetical protein [Streptomyces phyllanthi]
MEIRAAHGGGIAVRWAYGVFLTLCVALAVLVHHETSMTSMTSMTAPPPMPAPAHAAHAMPEAAHAMPEEAHAAVGHEAPSASDSPAHGVDSGGCAMPGMQHCTTASVGSVQLAAPGQTSLAPPADPEPTAESRAPARAVGRAPPDLSVLSQLRI